MFSTEHYEVIARVIRNRIVREEASMEYEVAAGVKILAHDLVEIFAADNPRFSEDVFKRAYTPHSGVGYPD